MHRQLLLLQLFAVLYSPFCFAQGENVAVNKTATQSSTFSGYDPFTGVTFTGSASLAVDGNRSQRYRTGVCSSTVIALNGTKADCNDKDGCWWMVNLGRKYTIQTVKIYGRDEYTTGPMALKCGDETVATNLYLGLIVLNISVQNVAAETVTISFKAKGSDAISLCEVEVYATTDVDECLSPHCENNGTCINQIGSYGCICTTGYHGKNCELDVFSTASPKWKSGDDLGVLAGIGIGIAISIVVITIIFTSLYCYRQNRRDRRDNQPSADQNVLPLPGTPPKRLNAFSTIDTFGNPISLYETLEETTRIHNVPNEYEIVSRHQLHGPGTSEGE